MEEAARLFNTKGYATASMDEIAAACKCDVANLYNYFPSKEHILYEGIKYVIAFSVGITEEVEKKTRLTPAGKLRELIVRQLEARASSIYSDLFSKHRANLEPEHIRDLIAIRDVYDSKMRRIIADGIKAGEFRPVDEKIVSTLISSFIERFLLWYSPKGRLTPVQVADMLFDLLTNGIGRQEGRTRTASGRPERRSSKKSK